MIKFYDLGGYVLSMGCSLEQANRVFILPNPPKGDYELDSNQHLALPNTQDIITQDGNHWRKILTIMAKLCCAESDWRWYRDSSLLQHKEAILFHIPSHFQQDVLYFICGGEMQSQLALKPEICPKNKIDELGQVKVSDNLIFCPYLDYRQFPNQLIDTLCHSFPLYAS